MKNKVFTRGDTAYIQLLRKGKPPLYARIDKSDLPLVEAFQGSWVPKWNVTAKTYYARANKHSTSGHPGGYMHRAIMGIFVQSIQVDHLDHKGLNNRRRNLQRSDYVLNGFNRKGRQSNNRYSKHRNVYWNKREKKWMVWAVHNKKTHYVGYFVDLSDAVTAAKKLRRGLK